MAAPIPASTLQLRIFRHLWGVGEPVADLDGFKAAGYEGLEFYPPAYPGLEEALRAGMDRLHWPCVVQVITSGRTVAEHLRSLHEQVAAGGRFGPLFYNVQSGLDAFGDAEAAHYFGEALKLEADLPVPMLHETHRGKILCNPWRTRRILESFAGLKVVADFSHFVCGCERLPDDLEETFRIIAGRSRHIHTRVGHEQGPQVYDPRAPEYARHLQAHERWWSWIWEAAARRGEASITATPEFGPPPYQPAWPLPDRPAVPLGVICDWMAGRNREQFARWSAALGARG
jgi:sugar phosphate isomerase/epimerase